MATRKEQAHVCQVMYGVDKSLAFEWIHRHLDPSIHKSYIFVGLKKGAFYRELSAQQPHVYFLKLRPGKLGYLILIWQLFIKFLKLRPDVIHAHIFPAPFCAMVAGKIVGIRKRIYTRHHSTYNHDNYPKAVKLDKMTNRYATHIVAISQNVRQVLEQEELVNPSKIVDIPHGFDLSIFSDPKPETIEGLRQQYNPNGKAPVIGVIARMIAWKGHTDIIAAFKQLLELHPNALLILANARGPAADQIKAQLDSELPANSHALIEFESEIGALYQLFDVYVHTPVNPQIEAFGQTYVEALAAGVPSVFTLSGVAHEFVQHEHNALIVDYNSPDQILAATERLLRDAALRERITTNARQDISPRFELQRFINDLDTLYLS